MGLIRKIKRGFALRILLHVTKGLANGKYGRRPQKAYSALAGLKTYIGLAFMATGYIFGAAFNLGVCPDCPEWDKILMGVGAVLAQIGLLDAANREDGPDAAEKDPFLRRSARGGTQG